MRGTKAFTDAVDQTMRHLATLGVDGIGRASVADVIEQNMTAVAVQLHVRPQSAWQYFDAAGLAASLAEQMRVLGPSDDGRDAGKPPLPPVDSPELALLMAEFPDLLASCGGDLFTAVLTTAINAWKAGHIHGEDGCSGCGDRGVGGHDYHERISTLTRADPNIRRWLDPRVFAQAMRTAGYAADAARR